MGKKRHLPEFRRSERFNRLIREEVSRLLQGEVRDPRISDVVITEVKTSEDLRHARVYYACREMEPEKREVVQTGLERASGFMRGKLGRNLHVRYSPKLTFHFDPSIEYGARIDGILQGLKSGERDEKS